MTYRQLSAENTLATLQTLRNRISERFDNSSLAGVAGELREIANESQKKINWIERPHIGLRAAILVVVLLSLVLIGFGVNELAADHDDAFGLSEAVGMLESVLNEIIVAGAALLFLFSLEVRVKRTRALQVLHDLRAMAHVIDMHQLTKGPSQILNARAAPTKSSPQRILTPFQLTRYLDYCSEMLSLIGKIAALYAQSLPDAVVVAAVNDIETLTNGLSRKIWQKIVMVDDVVRFLESGGTAKQTPEAQWRGNVLLRKEKQVTVSIANSGRSAVRGRNAILLLVFSYSSSPTRLLLLGFRAMKTKEQNRGRSTRTTGLLRGGSLSGRIQREVRRLRCCCMFRCLLSCISRDISCIRAPGPPPNEPPPGGRGPRRPDVRRDPPSRSRSRVIR